jgi:2-(1,2-epoxy-1,2-dihydrophenyl)acetyl-CoA isomerase
MKAKAACYERHDFYWLEYYDDVAVLRLGKKFLSNAINMASQNPLLDILDQIAAKDEITVMVIMNCLEQIGCEEYIAYCRQTLRAEADHRSIQRMCNFFDQLLLRIVNLNKPVIHADCGEVISLFLGISLACDYRIIATHTIFQKPYFELGTLPKGGSPFFLCKMLGYDRTKKLFMSEKDINAIEAVELGIVDQVVPFNKLEETTIQMAQDWTKKPISSMAGIKRLINYSMKDLNDYLSFESQELLRTIGTL